VLKGESRRYQDWLSKHRERSAPFTARFSKQAHALVPSRSLKVDGCGTG
jgi:hypothetical protein